MNSPIPVLPYLTSIALNYKNVSLIADNVLPRVPVGKQLFRYLAYPQGDQFTVPDTKVGRTSKVNQVEFGATALTASTVDYALDNPIPQIDVLNAVGTGYDPESRGVELTTDLILLDREVRAASLVFSVGGYDSAHKEVLTYPWDNATSSTPIEDITSALDSMLMRPNIMVLGNSVATALQTNPAILKAFYGNLGDSGIVPVQFLATLFGLDAVYVGRGWLNIAKPGQPVTLQRVWGNMAALIYRNSLATADQGMSFGLTAQFEERYAGRIIDQDLGMRGGVRVRVGESVKELILAPDLGFLFENAHS